MSSWPMGASSRRASPRTRTCCGPCAAAGANFGVVTSFRFRLHPVHTVGMGITLWRIEQIPEVLRWYRDFLPRAPEDLNGFFALLPVPPAPPFPEEIRLKKMCGVVWCYLGDPTLQDEVFAPVQR